MSVNVNLHARIKFIQKSTMSADPECLFARKKNFVAKNHAAKKRRRALVTQTFFFSQQNTCREL